MIKKNYLIILFIITSFAWTQFQPQSKAELRTAVDLWVSDNVTALSTYGQINTWDTSLITSMSHVFNGGFYDDFNDDISNWDVSNVTMMEYMFKGGTFNGGPVSSFNQDLSNWDVSNVTNMDGMFLFAENFNGDISTWDVSSVTTMYGMFHYAISFNQDISNWNVSSVTKMMEMFYEAHSFNIDISNWDVSNVANMEAMFRGSNCIFNQDISSWNVSNLTDMDYMFRETSSFNQDISTWTSVLPYQPSMEWMFYASSGLSDVNKCAIYSAFQIYPNWLAGENEDWSDICNLLGINDHIPIEYNLTSAYPNPFNPVTNISFEIPLFSNVIIQIYNIRGEMIEELFNGIKSPGKYHITWNAAGFSSGVYFVSLISQDFVGIQKIMLIK